MNSLKLENPPFHPGNYRDEIVNFPFLYSLKKNAIR